LSSQIKAEKVTKAILDVVFLDDKGEWISHEWAAYIGAKKANDPPADHDWKEYSGRVKIPKGTKKIQIGLQIYGPGKVWFDEVRAAYVE
jgi:RNA polymerase sigma-70 factor (ECF subfamily)